MKFNHVLTQVQLFQDDIVKLKMLRKMLGIKYTETLRSITMVDRAIKRLDELDYSPAIQALVYKQNKELYGGDR